jgi:hypothetical protein
MDYNTYSSLHRSSPFRRFLLDSSSKRELAFPLLETIFNDYVIYDLAAEDAPPAEEFLGEAKKFFVGHDSAATIALHN